MTNNQTTNEPNQPTGTALEEMRRQGVYFRWLGKPATAIVMRRVLKSPRTEEDLRQLAAAWLEGYESVQIG